MSLSWCENCVSRHDIIAIGASAGGVEALTKLVRGLPKDLPAAVFVVVHIPASGTSLLPQILSAQGTLPAVQAVDGQAVEPGRIYLAPPDHHLLLEDSRMRCRRGPRENRTRPAIDPLFRTAAQAYGPRVAGVVLSGTLQDGTAGLSAIKQAGGVAVVQDPQEALFPSMPESALRRVPVDYVLPVPEISPLLARLARPPQDGSGPSQKERDA